MPRAVLRTPLPGIILRISGSANVGTQVRPTRPLHTCCAADRISQLVLAHDVVTGDPAQPPGCKRRRRCRGPGVGPGAPDTEGYGSRAGNGCTGCHSDPDARALPICCPPVLRKDHRRRIASAGICPVRPTAVSRAVFEATAEAGLATGDTCHLQGVAVIYVDWSPPVGGDREMIELLDRLL